MPAADSTFGSVLVAYAEAAGTFVLPPILAAILSGYLVLRWKGRGEYLEKRLDELCDMIDAAADFSAEYWNHDQLDSNSLLNEARARAQFMKIAGLRALVEFAISNSSASELRLAEAAFFRETTGGAFGVHNREADPLRIVSIRYTAAEFVVAIRMARMRDIQGVRQRR
jgi:hypothetical protein